MFFLSIDWKVLTLEIQISPTEPNGVVNLKKDKLLCDKYRPIFLLPIFSKIFEKVVLTSMYSLK